MDQKFPFISSSSLTFHHCICTLIVILLSSLLLLNVLPPLQSLSLLNVPFVSSPSSSSRSDDCDYSNGRWVWDDNRNAESYSEECKFLDPGFRCVENGRNHTGYRNWRWQPHGCDLPRYMFFLISGRICLQGVFLFLCLVGIIKTCCLVKIFGLSQFLQSYACNQSVVSNFYLSPLTISSTISLWFVSLSYYINNFILKF